MKFTISLRTHWTLIIICFLFISCSQSNLVENIKDDVVVAVINGKDIHVEELRKEIKLSMKKFRVTDLSELPKEETLLLKINGLNKIIQNILLNMEAVSNNIFLTRNEYKDSLDAAKKGYQGNSFSKFLESEGISLERWESKFKSNLLLKKLISDVVNQEITISEDQIKKHYDNHKLEFKKGEQVRSLHIMVESESEIRNIIKELKSDKNKFSNLAKIYSLGPESHLGGDLGYFEKGQMPEEFDGVFKIKAGQISDVIKSPYGYHIFMVIDKKQDSQMTFDESYKTIYNKLMREEQSRVFDKWILNLKNKSEIEIKYDVLAKIK